MAGWEHQAGCFSFEQLSVTRCGPGRQPMHDAVQIFPRENCNQMVVDFNEHRPLDTQVIEFERGCGLQLCVGGGNIPGVNNVLPGAVNH